MREVSVLLALAAAAGLGYLLVRRLDRFVKQAPPEEPGRGSLRIGFSDPTAAGGAAEALERFSREEPETAVQLYSGTEEELIEELSARRLDVILIPDRFELPEGLPFLSGAVRLERRPLLLRRGGTPVHPVRKDSLPLCVLWHRTADGRKIRHLTECLRAFGGPQ